MSTQTMAQELAALRAENAALKARPEPKAQVLTVKVSKAGAISVYGMGQFPATFYKEQWIKLFGIQDKILAVANLPEAEFKAQQQIAINKAAVAKP